MERLSLQEQEEMEKRARLEKLKQTVTVKVSRDPARLLQLTAGWKERKKADPEIVFSGSLLNIPKRYTYIIHCSIVARFSYRIFS